MRSDIFKKGLAVVIIFLATLVQTTIPDHLVDLFGTGVDSISVEDTVPRILDEENFGKILSLSDDKNKKKIATSYEIYNKNTKTTNENKSLVPKDSDSSYYLIRPEVDIDNLSKIMKSSILKMVTVGKLEVGDELSKKIDRLNYTDSLYLSNSVISGIVKQLYYDDGIDVKMVRNREQMRLLSYIFVEVILYILVIVAGLRYFSKAESEDYKLLRKNIYAQVIKKKKSSDNKYKELLEGVVDHDLEFVEKNLMKNQVILVSSIMIFAISLIRILLIDLVIFVLFFVTSMFYFVGRMEIKNTIDFGNGNDPKRDKKRRTIRGITIDTGFLVYVYKILIGICVYLIFIKSIPQGNIGNGLKELIYGALVLGVLYRLSNNVDVMLKLKSSVKNIESLIEVDSEDRIRPRFNKSSKLSVRNVCYTSYSEGIIRYNGPISLEASKGELVSVISDDIIDISSVIVGDIPYSDGEVLINDFNINSISEDLVYSMVSIVDNDPMVFRDSIKNNILYSNLVGVDRLKKCIEITWIENLFETKDVNKIVEEDISHKQKMAISISRAIARNFEILVLDGCFDDLDTGYSRSVINAIRSEFGDRSILLITKNRDLSNLADRVIEI